ncbi:uncharacterized protein FIBRA_08976 [Fibroporia radiculosa]|uniref:non-specific serine/threonine protein kinase n=1 Tax=Fibroporia radiculosa TaxID=599839 RepID=J4H5G3_9APHY|nr:uncharacterized protein FIBRA_08976 [Fibroporia radiculosa]CCM06689.1 predicted protein [Fibroporia radiculosa]
MKPVMESVRLKEGDGEEFTCDEEPHMLPPETGYGYLALTLGHHLDQDKRDLEIVRKLGWGGYSNVWLATPHKYATTSSPLVFFDLITHSRKDYRSKYVAVKVMTVNATAGAVYGHMNEVKSLRLVTSKNPDHPGYKHCVTVEDLFIEKGKYGPHYCLVTQVHGRHMDALQSDLQDHHFSVSATKRIIKQTLLALDYLHTECKLIHGDLKPANILYSPSYQDDAIARHIEDSPSSSYEPRLEPDLSPDPIITVRSQPLPNFGLQEDMSNINICLVDYGETASAEQEHTHPSQPTLLRAPEVVVGYPWSTAVDIWSIGGLVFEFLIGNPFFALYETDSVSLEDSLLRRMIEHIGPFPPHLLEKGTRRDEYFDAEGTLIRVKEFRPQSIEDCLKIYNILDSADIAPAAAFIRRCLTMDPEKRPTAKELLEDEWLKDA